MEDLECLYKACQAAVTDGGLFTDTAWRRLYRCMHERGENKRLSENDCEMKTVQLGQGAREPTRVGANKTKKERIVHRETF